MFYDIPMTTYDLDVLVVLPTEDDYHALYEYFRNKGAKIENVYIFIEESNVVDLEGVSCKFVRVEHLVLLLLTSFRPKDKIRIDGLLNKVNKGLLERLIKRFDDEKHTLYERYQSLLAGT